MEDDSIRLVIDSNLAYLNDKKHTLDVAPAIINNRTMLPIRFIAEGFDLGVAWNSETKTVTLIKQEFSSDEYEFIMSQVPTYSGKPYTEVNSNVPLFKQYEFIDASFEHYNDVDYLGRCGVCIASVSKELMPTEERGSISSVKPTGWQSVTYENVNGSYLYNRCHLIGFQLTGENANRENLITGTRYLNINGMLDFENDVAEYVKNTGNHVMYRVTPVFISSNLVADGLLMEGYSVEDNGAGISFCVYCYNVQPGIEINYADGTSKRNESYNQAVNTENNTVTAVFILNTNTKKFHCESCSSADDIKPENREISHFAASELVNAGYSACKICNPK
ncbi:MAG: DNA/RNA non-specific endonuclease [Clostridia bacterium]|nr:DNA/RNA non-specific endonuclease [Clostridia bacterium]